MVSGKSKKTRDYTSKQMGDACEMIVASELTLAGIPALKVPDNWPHYDVIAQPKNGLSQRISVKSRTYKKGSAYLSYDVRDKFDWLAIVLLECPDEDLTKREVYIIPRKAADRNAYKNKKGTPSENNRYYAISSIKKKFGKYENNFSLKKI